MTPTFRALCVELVDAADLLCGSGYSPGQPGSRLILTVHVDALEELAARARAALAQPEPVARTDEAELRTVYAIGAEARWREGFPEAWSLTDMERAAHTAGLRAVLARWGTPANTINQEDYDRG